MSTTCTDARPDQPIPQHHDYLAAARRDPRDHPFGYLARDPMSGARGAFLWFRSASDLKTWIRTREVDLLQLDDEDATRIKRRLTGILSQARDVSRLDRRALSSAFEGWDEIAWVGVFGDLCTRGGELATSLRLEFRLRLGLGHHAGPIEATEVSDFVVFLRTLFEL